jgi:hypothetical protein
VPVVTTSIGIEGYYEAKTFIEVCDTPKDFAQSIINLLSNENLRKEKAKNGKIYANNNFTLDSIKKVFANDIFI